MNARAGVNLSSVLVNKKTCTAVSGSRQCRVDKPNCIGQPFCVHDCYEQLSREGMRAHVQFDCGNVLAPVEWVARLKHAIARQIHPTALLRCGWTAELLAFCGISLNELLCKNLGSTSGVAFVRDSETRVYALEHLLQTFQWSFADLRLLGFDLMHLRSKTHYPLVMLYKHANVRADDLFRLHIGYDDIVSAVVEPDERYARLLDINLAWCKTVLGSQQG